MSAKDYFGIQNQKEELFKEAIEAFNRLEARYNPIVLEGAGSISELNLRDRDITNMRMAMKAGASTYADRRYRPGGRIRLCIWNDRFITTGGTSVNERGYHQ